jgi:hypothetical protein
LILKENEKMLRIIKDFPFDFDYKIEYFSIICMSFFCFLFIYRIVSPSLSKKLTHSYSRLVYNHKVEWNMRFTSTIFSIVVSTICIYIFIVDHAINSSPLLYDSTLVKTNIAIVIGYTLFDIVVMAANYKIIGDAFTFFHHLFSIFGYSHALVKKKFCLYYFQGFSFKMLIFI